MQLLPVEAFNVLFQLYLEFLEPRLQLLRRIVNDALELRGLSAQFVIGERGKRLGVLVDRGSPAFRFANAVAAEYPECASASPDPREGGLRAAGASAPEAPAGPGTAARRPPFLECTPKVRQ